MANSEHVAKLRQGVDAWNQWRKAHRKVRPDLSGADLSRVRLSPKTGDSEAKQNALMFYVGDRALPDGADLQHANCSKTRWVGAVLRGADFSGADLSGADLTGADLSAARFRNALLDEAVFDKARLQEADFTEAQLEKSRFVGAFLYHADFTKAQASGARFWGALLSTAKFDGAELVNASFAKARMVETSFAGAMMLNADLRMAVAKEAYFQRAYLSHASLEGATLEDALLREANLVEADLRGATLTEANLDGCDLGEADLSGAKARNATLRDAALWKAKLAGADLRGAKLTRADLRRANLERADLRGATLRGSLLMNATLKRADISNCKVYGISAWDVDLTGATQRDLVFTPKGEPAATVDDLEVAQFIYLLSKNEKIRRLLDTVTKKVVLILGRFSGPRLEILEVVRKELRKRGYVPVLFTFEASASRNLTETVSTLASLVRFVVADITDPKSVPQELQAIVSQLVSVPIQPIILARQKPYGMFESIQERQSVLPLFRYDRVKTLRKSFSDRVVRPAEELASSIVAKRARVAKVK